MGIMLNPTAVGLFVCATSVGYFFGGDHWAACAAACSSGLSLVVSFFVK